MNDEYFLEKLAPSFTLLIQVLQRMKIVFLQKKIHFEYMKCDIHHESKQH